MVSCVYDDLIETTVETPVAHESTIVYEGTRRSLGEFYQVIVC